jgi:hypothetical protein
MVAIISTTQAGNTMGNFFDKNMELRRECLNFIKEAVIAKGGRYEFATQEEIDSDDFEVWDLAIVSKVDKYEDNYDYGITSITLERDSLWFNGLCHGEDSSDYCFGESEIETSTLCDIADMVE